MNQNYLNQNILKKKTKMNNLNKIMNSKKKIRIKISKKEKKKNSKMNTIL